MMRLTNSESQRGDCAKYDDTKTPWGLSLISASPISGEENDLHALKCIQYETTPLIIARFVGLELFSPTGLTQPSQVRI